MSDHLQPIYDVWGGNAEALAADIDELGVTVRQWRNRGDIPSRVWPKIITAAAAKGHELRLEDFLVQSVKNDLPPHALSDSETPRALSATNNSENIRSDGEGGPGHPFPPSSATSSQTPAHQRSHRASPAFSDGEAETA